MPALPNFIAFQLGWFACVLGAANGFAWAGSSLGIAIVAWQLQRAPRARTELVLVLVAAAIGALWDSALAAIGWIRYPSGELIEGLAPHWIVMLWMLFATTLNSSLAWLKRSMLLAAAFGALGGPLAYLAGAKLGALELAEQSAALIALAVGWAVITPLLLQVAHRFDGYRVATHTAAGTEASHA